MQSGRTFLACVLTAVLVWTTVMSAFVLTATKVSAGHTHMAAETFHSGHAAHGHSAPSKKTIEHALNHSAPSVPDRNRNCFIYCLKAVVLMQAPAAAPIKPQVETKVLPPIRPNLLAARRTSPQRHVRSWPTAPPDAGIMSGMERLLRLNARLRY